MTLAFGINGANVTHNLPFSQACENNKGPILDKLANIFSAPGLVLEIGTGTGQHAVHFAGHLPHLTWQPSDHPQNYQLCLPRLKHAGLANLREPRSLDVCQSDWNLPDTVNGVFSANTAHIMSWPEVERMFEGVAGIVSPGSAFCLYGPFRYDGQHTSASNLNFDQHLRSQNPSMGIRDMIDLIALAERCQLSLDEDIEMPANNRMTVWRRQS
ncbi:DUF938 domain-containing protein [Marinobacter alexandrii]|jgi:hypothetical protein|uniref:DUF938 domain-containing protein n=1 Tax=Marinobacter alexandrii TaxID=2570351 RepID=UPI001FFFC311|nr:DUF938 domain-containing protein [Marinobacter alexandrii]MCK2148892.1 class I SAM-dependent methyltransferase [Marinobacter alexandrii]